MKKQIFSVLLSGILIIALNSCQKDKQSFGSLYTPSALDVTSTASLEQLNLGKLLYMNNCGNCHGLYSPDTFSPSEWKIVLNGMVPRTGLTNDQANLVSKYLSRGKL